MIKINLLPPELRPRKKTTLSLKGMSLINAGIAAVLIISYVTVGVKIGQEKRKLSRLKGEYQIRIGKSIIMKSPQDRH